MERWMERRGGGRREVGAGDSLGGSEGGCGGEVEGLEAGRKAGLNEKRGESQCDISPFLPTLLIYCKMGLYYVVIACMIITFKSRNS